MCVPMTPGTGVMGRDTASAGKEIASSAVRSSRACMILHMHICIAITASECPCLRSSVACRVLNNIIVSKCAEVSSGCFYYLVTFRAYILFDMVSFAVHGR